MLRSHVLIDCVRRVCAPCLLAATKCGHRPSLVPCCCIGYRRARGTASTRGHGSSLLQRCVASPDVVVHFGQCWSSFGSSWVVARRGRRRQLLSQQLGGEWCLISAHMAALDQLGVACARWRDAVTRGRWFVCRMCFVSRRARVGRSVGENRAHFP